MGPSPLGRIGLSGALAFPPPGREEAGPHLLSPLHIPALAQDTDVLGQVRMKGYRTEGERTSSHPHEWTCCRKKVQMWAFVRRRLGGSGKRRGAGRAPRGACSERARAVVSASVFPPLRLRLLKTSSLEEVHSQRGRGRKCRNVTGVGHSSRHPGPLHILVSAEGLGTHQRWLWRGVARLTLTGRSRSARPP